MVTQPIRLRATVAEETGHRRIQLRALGHGIEPLRVQFAAQPGELALGQLASGGDGPRAEFRHRCRAVQMLPGLAIAHGAQRRQVQRLRMRGERRQCAQRPHLTEETIRHAASRIRQAQDMLGRRLVIENVSSYLQYQQSTMSEWDFLCAVAEEADCHILLDVNNIYVSACNHDFAPLDYLNAIPVERVQEIHLAGYEDRGTHLLDTHGYPVSDAVWELYAQAIQRLGAIPTLIEWENNVPELGTLLTEARKAAEVQAHVLA